MRINKYIARGLGYSRRAADETIQSGRVTIDGQTANIGQIVPEGGVVRYNQEIVTLPDFTYVLLHKPAGYVCSRKKQDDADTIYSLIPKHYHHLKSAGRLDKDTSGVLLLTDDGDYINELTHPSSQKKKTYIVELERPLSDEDLAQIQTGVELTDGTSSIEVQPLLETSSYTLTMKEGRNRQIRRTFGALGYTVVKLHRIGFGPYSIGDVESGQSIEVTKRQ